jgi:hypothetical protein
LLKAFVRFLTVLLLVAATHSLAAEGDVDPRSRYTQSAHLRLSARTDGGKHGHSATWRGNVQLSGVLAVEFDRGPVDEPRLEFGAGAVYFEPDANTLRRLPRAVGPFHPLAPRVIWIENTKPIPMLTKLLGPNRAEELARGDDARIEIPVIMQLVELGTSIDCDHRSFGMAFASVRRQSNSLVAVAKAKNFGC